MGLVFGNIFKRSDNLYDYLDGNNVKVILDRIETTTNRDLFSNDDALEKISEFIYRIACIFRDGKLRISHNELCEITEWARNVLHKSFSDQRSQKGLAGIYILEGLTKEDIKADTNYNEVSGVLNIGESTKEDVEFYINNLKDLRECQLNIELVDCYENFLLSLYNSAGRIGDFNSELLKDLEYYMVVFNKIYRTGKIGGELLSDKSLLQGTDRQVKQLDEAINGGVLSLASYLNENQDTPERIMRYNYYRSVELLANNNFKDDVTNIPFLAMELIQMAKKLRIPILKEMKGDDWNGFVVSIGMRLNPAISIIIRDVRLTDPEEHDTLKRRLKNYLKEFSYVDNTEIEDFVNNSSPVRLVISERGLEYSGFSLRESEEVGNFMMHIMDKNFLV